MLHRPEGIRENLMVAGVVATPAVVAVLVGMTTGNAAAGWLTLAILTTVLIAGLAVVVLRTTEHSWRFSILTGAAVVVLLLAPVLLDHAST